jgi:hypothetical protein
LETCSRLTVSPVFPEAFCSCRAVVQPRYIVQPP